jgi:hypothetical protein
VNYYLALIAALKNEFPAIHFSFTLCCGEDAAIAHDALRLGFASIVCDCAAGPFAELTQTAASLGATVARPSNALDPAVKAAKPMSN